MNNVTEDECLELATDVIEVLSHHFDINPTESEHAALAISLAQWLQSIGVRVTAPVTRAQHANRKAA